MTFCIDVVQNLLFLKIPDSFQQFTGKHIREYLCHQSIAKYSQNQKGEEYQLRQAAGFGLCKHTCGSGIAQKKSVQQENRQSVSAYGGNQRQFMLEQWY